VAESVLGPEHGLHSKAPGVLALLLQEDLLTPQDFGAAADKAAAAATADQQAAAGGSTQTLKAHKGPKGVSSCLLLK